MITYSKIYNVMERLREKEKDILQNGKSSLCAQSRNNKIDNLIFEKLAASAMNANSDTIDDAKDVDSVMTDIRKAVYNFIKENMFYIVETIDNRTIVNVYPLITSDVKNEFKENTGYECFSIRGNIVKTVELDTIYIIAFQELEEATGDQYNDMKFKNNIAIAENIMYGEEVKFTHGRYFPIASYISVGLFLNNNMHPSKDIRKCLFNMLKDVSRHAIGYHSYLEYSKLLIDEDIFNKILNASQAYCNIGQFFDKEDIAYYWV